jgi:transcriptional regulator with XRE-family HTH domain
MSVFGTYIKALMDGKGWSQVDLAVAVDVAPSTVNNWLNNTEPVIPKPATLNRLADKLGVTRREMLEYAGFEIEDSPTPEARAGRIANLIEKMPRVKEITEELFALAPEEQDVALSVLEAHLRERRRHAQSTQKSP